MIAFGTQTLRNCPFCGWDGIHMRKKTKMRESVTGLTYMRGYDQYHPLSLGYVGTEYREEPCYDYRFGIRFYCGKCKAETPYVWGEWHLPTEDEAETFDDMPHACDRFNPDVERATIDNAIAAWNRRQSIDSTPGAETCRNVYLVEESDELIESWCPLVAYLSREAAEGHAELLRGEYDGIRQFARVVELKVVGE